MSMLLPSSKKYPTRNSQNSGGVPRKTSVSSAVCAICCGAYTEDVDAATGKTTSDLIHRSDEDCGVCSHFNCLQKTCCWFCCVTISNIMIHNFFQMNIFSKI